MRGGRAREQEMGERWMEGNRREVRMEGRKGRDGKEGGDIFLAWVMFTSERQSSSINPKQNWGVLWSVHVEWDGSSQRGSVPGETPAVG